ncbi:ribonuclease III [Alcanivorax sp. S71-1-4]|jgi:ribonuclease III|uniref:ribonuclease III n=1 Tax=Alcanivorax sp. S71-1-4 TaxID=1177159 RepID=UPI00135BF5EA|nr:ribonuclease III [Alcanivorax sp. S71-1-4]KAF0805735.1 ribonuclease III [Alcanivorax sp. S71-1-4]
MTAVDLARLCKRLGYQFQDERLLQQALTHRSADRRHNNERLEFLGDAQLGQIITRWLFDHFPEAREGQLTRMRSILVRGAMLAEVARELDLGACLLLGGGEMKSGGHRRDSILADALEAVVGALLLEAGEDVCRRVVLAWFASRLAEVSPQNADKDAKTRLQEWLQARQLPLPEYTVLDIRGQAPDQQFDLQCALTSHDQTFTATGSSRRRAEQDAAAAALAWLEEQA